MRILNKIIEGHVVQSFNKKTGQWLDQEFITGDESYETQDGEFVDEMDIEVPADLPILLVQPFQTKQRIEWDCDGSKWIEIESDGEGSGELKSNLKMKCPYCDMQDCYGDCKVSQWYLMDPETQQLHSSESPIDIFPDKLESVENIEARKTFNSSIDGMESFLLSLVCHGETVTGFGKAISFFVECLAKEHSYVRGF